MKTLWKKLELEWKILLAALAFFLAFAIPVQHTISTRMLPTLQQGVDPELESLLRQGLARANPNEQAAWIASIERFRQWNAMIPIIVAEQQRIALGLLVMVCFVFAAFALWTLKRMTRPLKELAIAADAIGKGKRPIIDDNAGGALGRLQESMKEMQYELEVLREKSITEGMEKAWRDIARVMAHEIKNPLTPIRLTLDRLEEQVRAGKQITGDDLLKMQERIASQVALLERLVGNFSSFAKEPEVKFKKVALRSVLSNIAEGMRHSLATSFSGDATIEADPYLLNQIALNIWKNSVEANATEMAVVIVREGGFVAVTMTDNGPGLPPDRMEKVWVPYVTYKPGGTGLGLPVVKKLVEAMHGHIILENSREHGLSLRMTFPAIE
ncbi:MAG: hypothetical protein A2487_08920 [Candidatus Raymondbacteria bacterium RifOxyC12_full_50_8]|uniref:histidine kinase n=1 Tax=Candidatus Raymondbacteria bacterium RIFOXYD12_FULL_49_13 TaxID=1817890 RepID=A0A1F7FI20_UNCRA|nr:MAG: hypothetical protein A2248_21525 [Candidatus Raymondbacteria bacterium RIFOXYA2_FULL_49_16]OGJ94687.1 MAG: hypothetical protein A2350_08500 [Candidatus Raymondbacteria bacterium RifOxyB12_full_50_8]OGK04549.1 MAG: hypothetical protein A2487_08920 [Candidatus Raymondbacteria bacterium RifOxyC12_full_50_8]OGK06365.1 MAG: hypothetical protein A2519_08850 [Candidatus Raymondbacteria bacterium RIFOXYD12_FULL_49_13]OGP40699.1 MAG: hypothetical protein A2324_03595 [Candidatus Raymondbacteria b